MAQARKTFTTSRIAPRRRAARISRRRQLEEAIEAAIAALDELDEDPDLEPSLGAVETSPGIYGGRGDQETWGYSDDLDLEDEHDGAEPDVDDEPWLGWRTAEVCLECAYGDGFGPDREEDAGDEAEFECDGPDEHDFPADDGTAFAMNQLPAYAGATW